MYDTEVAIHVYSYRYFLDVCLTYSNQSSVAVFMMTSSNGNFFFRVTDPLCGEFTGAVTRSFDVFFDLPLNKRLSKQPWGWWYETPVWSLWRHRNVMILFEPKLITLMRLGSEDYSKLGIVTTRNNITILGCINCNNIVKYSYVKTQVFLFS